MAWTGLVLTVDGQNTLNNAQFSGRMQIKAIAVGDGATPTNFRTLKRLVNQLYVITDIKIDKTVEGCIITADFPKVDYDYYFREIGVIVDTDQGEKLYVYDNCGDDAQYIVSTTGVESTRKRIRLALNISDVAEITISNSSILYVTYDDFEQVTENLREHVSDKNNPHGMTPEQLGLDPTSDMEKPVSTAQQAALDTYYQQATGYTDRKIAALINGAPEDLDTLKEIADAMAENHDVVEALNAAIGKKANQAEMDSLLGTKLDKTGDSKDAKVTFGSSDTLTPAAWTDVAVLKSGETHKSIFAKVSAMFKNIRYLWGLVSALSASGAITEVKIVEALPADAASHPTTFYWVKG